MHNHNSQEQLTQLNYIRNIAERREHLLRDCQADERCAYRNDHAHCQSTPNRFSCPILFLCSQNLANHRGGGSVDSLHKDFQELLDLVANAVCLHKDAP